MHNGWRCLPLYQPSQNLLFERNHQDLNQNLSQYSVVYQQYHQVSTDSIQKAQQAVDKVAQALTEVANKAVATKTENPKSKIDKGMM